MVNGNANISQAEEQTLSYSEQQTLCHFELVSGSKKEIPNQVRNDKKTELKAQCHSEQQTLCHSELVSGSKKEIPNQVRNDKKIELKAQCYPEHQTLCHSEQQILRHSELVSESHVYEPVSGSKKPISDIIKSAKKALAFTLAETLIVMGIIGVVAALTIPNLNSSTADKEKIARVKKVYSNLEDAFGRATAVYGPVAEWFNNMPSGYTESDVLLERITDFMKVTKSCSQGGSGCFYDGFYKVKGLDLGEDSPSRFSKSVLLADGTSLNFIINNISSGGGLLNEDVYAVVYIDIDGAKGSNEAGKDYFEFYLANSGIYPVGAENTTTGKDANALKDNCFKKWKACTGWVIQNGNMDYLKADTSGKCPNGKTLNWTTNTSCK